jgi:hypothetical protein
MEVFAVGLPLFPSRYNRTWTYVKHWAGGYRVRAGGGGCDEEIEDAALFERAGTRQKSFSAALREAVFEHNVVRRHRR